MLLAIQPSIFLWQKNQNDLPRSQREKFKTCELLWKRFNPKSYFKELSLPLFFLLFFFLILIHSDGLISLKQMERFKWRSVDFVAQFCCLKKRSKINKKVMTYIRINHELTLLSFLLWSVYTHFCISPFSLLFYLLELNNISWIVLGVVLTHISDCILTYYYTATKSC